MTGGRVCAQAVCALTLWLCSSTPAFGAIFGDVRGVVHDPDHRPLDSAAVTIRSRTSDYSRATQTDSEGEFHFTAVPIGDYIATVSRDGFAPAEQTFSVGSGSAAVLHYQLKLAPRKEAVEVTGTAAEIDSESSTTNSMVSRPDIARTPGAGQTNSVAMITSFVPGAYVAHDQLHVRGGHQVSWLVDGVPVPNTNIASNVGPQFDPKDIDYVEVARGGYSAEYGDRTYGVFNVAPRTGFERNREGEIVLTYGSFHQTNSQISFGDHTARLAWYGSVSGNRTDLGLEPPGPEILHDRGAGLSGFGSFIYNVKPADQIRVVASIRRDDYEIPNSSEEQAAGVRDLDQERDVFVNASWVHTAGPGLLLTISPFYHFNRADFLGGPNDPGISAQDLSASRYGGAQTTFSAVRGRHNARVGVYGFAQADNRTFSLTAADGSALTLRQTETRSGNLEALFLEDQFKAMGWLTLNGGVRLTHFGGAVSENAADPRLGIALKIPVLNWVARGSYSRIYQAPPLSTIHGPLLDFALQQGFGFLPLHGERDEESEFGIAIPLAGWTLDGGHFHLHARNYFDHDALGNSNIFLPLTIAAARVDGWEATLRSPTLFRRAQGHVAYSSQHAEAAGAVTGGLTDFSPPPSAYFLLDHDQRHTLSAGGWLNLPQRAWMAANLYYGSGFPDNGGPNRLPAHTTVDLSVGKNWENWSVSVQAINAGNRRVLLDNSLTFGGTHYMEPRQIFGELHYRFHF